MLKVMLLGQFDVRRNGTPIVIPSRAAQSLLAYLLLSAGTFHRREKLAGLLWPNTLEESARHNLRHELWRIRKAIEAGQPRDNERDYLSVDEFSIAFNANSKYSLDASILERVSAEGAAANDRGHLGDLIGALSVYRGELLPGFYDDWVVLERERLSAVFERKMARLLECLVEEKRWKEILDWGERWIALGQSPEPAYRVLMIAYSAMGDRSKVAAVYQRCVDALRKGIGVEPSEQTRALFEQLRIGSPKTKTEVASLLPVSPAPLPRRASAPITVEELPAPGEPPFMGLAYFDEGDADLFFGREHLTTKIATHLQQDHLLAVIVGASGSGKSSVVRAGLVPLLKQSNPRWQCHVITPTAHPLEALAATLTRDEEPVTATTTLIDRLARDPRSLRLAAERAMRQGGASHLLLVVDQFEELFTLCRDEFEREAFIDNLLGAIASEAERQVSVVITLRADFYAHCAQYPDLREALAKHQEYIGPMTPEELRRAIEEPARRGGWEFEPGLVDLLLREVGDEPGALPLLSHALLETWKRRRERTLTLKGYEESGGVRGAIAKTAETVFHRLPPDEQRIARSIFLRLTELGEGTQDTRRRAALSELVQRAENKPSLDSVLKTLADARLITTGEGPALSGVEGTAEVAHEALIREWSRLREWLNQDREGLRLHRRVTEDAQEWEKLGRDPGALYRGARLAQANEWAASPANASELNALERTFLNASQEFAEREEAEREAQRQRELEAAKKLVASSQRLAEEEKKRAEEQSRAARQLRLRAIHLTAALILALGMAGIALFFGNQARESAVAALANAHTAEDERLIATSRELSAASLNNLNVDPELSILLASRAVSLTYSIDRTVLPEALDAMHRAVQSSRTQLVLTGHTDEVNGVAFSPDGTRIATASDDNTAKVWDAATGKELLTLVGHTQFAGDTKFDAQGKRKGVEYVVFSPDGTHIATAGGDNTARIWDAATGKELFTLVGHTQLVRTVRYSPDGKYLATASADSTAKIWDAASGQLLLTLSGHTNAVQDVAFSPDGTRLATASRDQTVRVWDIAAALSTGATTAKQVLIIPDPAAIGAINGVTFSPDGKHIATAVTAQAKIWDATTGKELLDLPHQLNFVVQVAFSPDGTRLATASYSGQATVYDATTGNELMVLRGSTWISDVAFSPDGKRLVAATLDKTARVWNIGPTQELLTIVDPTGNINSLNYSPDGSRIVTGDQSNVAQIWDAATGKHLLTLSGHTDRLYGAVFSPDGTRVATASNDNTAKIWDATTGKELLTLAGHGKKLTEGPYNGLKDIAFSPDGKRVATGAVDGAAKVWDASTGKELLSIPADSVRVNTVAFSPDGSLIATGGSDNTAKLWEAATGKLLHTFSGHTTIVYYVAFSPDGKHLATSSCDATVKVWDVQTGKILLTLTGFTGCITKLAYSSDGRWLASTGSDQTARVWDATTGKELVTLTGHTANVSGAVFSPDGTKLATSSDDATVRIYLLRIEDLIALANARLTRTWTLPECVRYLHMEQCPEQP